MALLVKNFISCLLVQLQACSARPMFRKSFLQSASRGVGVASHEENEVFPERWLEHFNKSTLELSQRNADVNAAQVKNAFLHAWTNYANLALEYDDIDPINGQPHGSLGARATLVDSLSTMWLMGFKDEFRKATAAVEAMDFDNFDASSGTSVFEVTIRALGGLCSAHSLSGDHIFLSKATDLANKLLPCLNGQEYCGGLNNLAERGTLQLEFRYVSQQTKDPRYQRAADHVLQELLNGGIHVNSIGGGADSFYEYLLKVYLQAGSREDVLKDDWKQSMEQMRSHLLRKSSSGVLFVSDQRWGSSMGHLSCFVGGMLALGAHGLPPEELSPWWEKVGRDVTHTCYLMTRMTATGIAPESTTFSTSERRPQGVEILRELEDTEGEEAKALAGMAVGDARNHLRPEIAESVFYQHYYTGDPKYREWAAAMFKGFETSAKTQYGFAELDDVNDATRKNNRMESFFLAETLKYLYLTFAPPSVINLDEFVFNTEAHPLRIDSSAAVSFITS